MYPSFWFDVQRSEVKQIRELIIWSSPCKSLFILSNIETQSLWMVCRPMQLNVGCKDSIQGSKLSSSNLLKGTSALMHQVIINSRLFLEIKDKWTFYGFFHGGNKFLPNFTRDFWTIFRNVITEASGTYLSSGSHLWSTVLANCL